MRIAISNWQGRVSPVFDVAKTLLLVDVKGGKEIERKEFDINHVDPLSRAREVAAFGAGVLICGAISWPLEMAMNASGLHVIAQTCGPVEDVLEAFLRGELSADKNTFLMPGCCGRRRRFRLRRHGRPA
jgi:predicted Fe-Mo cluster-binding NifX family protein